LIVEDFALMLSKALDSALEYFDTALATPTVEEADKIMRDINETFTKVTSIINSGNFYTKGAHGNHKLSYQLGEPDLASIVKSFKVIENDCAKCRSIFYVLGDAVRSPAITESTDSMVTVVSKTNAAVEFEIASVSKPIADVCGQVLVLFTQKFDASKGASSVLTDKFSDFKALVSGIVSSRCSGSIGAAFDLEINTQVKEFFTLCHSLLQLAGVANKSGLDKHLMFGRSVVEACLHTSVLAELGAAFAAAAAQKGVSQKMIATLRDGHLASLHTACTAVVNGAGDALLQVLDLHEAEVTKFTDLVRVIDNQAFSGTFLLCNFKP
jgi:hypothetical protein